MLNKGRGGLIDLLGTADFREVERRVHEGDPEACRVYEAMVYQICKSITALLPAFDGEPVDRVLLTGGLARSERFVAEITRGVARPGLRRDRLPGRERDVRPGQGRPAGAQRQGEGARVRARGLNRIPRRTQAMKPIRSLDQLVADLKDQPSRRLAVAAGHDPNTIAAAGRAAAEGIAEVTLVGDGARIAALCAEHGLDRRRSSRVVDEPDTVEAGRRAVAMVRAGEADVLMKGLIATGDYMKQILHKETGLLPEGDVLTHVTVLRAAGLRRAPRQAAVRRRRGHHPAAGPGDQAADPAVLHRRGPQLRHRRAPGRPDGRHREGQPEDAGHGRGRGDPRPGRASAFPGAIVDGPLALDVALSPEACAIKGLDSPVGGAADILVFPNIESGNVFYKAATLLAGARLAAAVVGTSAPCVLTSRADDEESKFLSIALGCRLVR